MKEEVRDLLRDLFKIGAIKTGAFKLKSGLISPIYIDLRVVISFPKILKKIAALIWEQVQSHNLKFDVICGVPYTALPFATALSLEKEIPLLIRRKEGAKGYGTNKIIEGVFQKGQTCLVIEDLVTTGGSVLESVDSLLKEELVVRDVIVFLDREQGGAKNLKEKNLNLYPVITMGSLLDFLKLEKFLDEEMLNKIEQFIKSNSEVKPPEPKKKVILSYKDRSLLCKNPFAAKVFKLMEEKKSNLCLAADVTQSKELLSLAEAVGPYIVILKTHVDIISDFTPEFAQELQQIAKKHNFLIFEDRKFSDIGNTVQLQYTSGVFKMKNWADIVNVHVISGKGVLEAFKIIEGGERGVLVVAEMSSEGNFLGEDYSKKALELSRQYGNVVCGLIAQKCLDAEDPTLLTMTPGVSLEINMNKDNLGQRYRDVETVLGSENLSDVIIVGRAILNAKDPSIAAKDAQTRGWDAYLKRLTK